MKYIGLWESPSPRKIALITLYAVINGIPRKQTNRYCLVPATASAGIPIRVTIGFTRNTRTAMTTTDIPMKNVTVLPIEAEAASSFPAPTLLPIVTVVPIASPTMITVSICITCPPLETAVIPSTPSN